MKRFYILCLILACSSILTYKAWSEEKPLIYQVEIKKEISSTTWIYLKNGFLEANKLKAAALLIDMNTYGGLLEAADSMRTAILYSPIPVYVFINNNAASAGALISIACLSFRSYIDRFVFQRTAAMASTSTSTPLGSCFTATQERAGQPVK